jgi:two-component system phosphate regulon sensor histidine kinase PhoR
MFFHPAVVSLVVSILVTILGMLFTWLFQVDFNQKEILVFTLIFASLYIIVYLTLEILIFNEINKIYRVLDKLKQKEEDINFKIFKKTKNIPVKRKKLFEEVYTYVTKKQNEITELKKLEIFRREFLADISHELKTPIFAAQGFIHTLLDGAMNDKNIREKFLKKAAKSLDNLQELVNELITLSQLETGELKMNIVNFDIKQLTDDVIEILEEIARKNGVNIKYMENYPKTMVKGDPLQIKQVMKNLIENAIHYGGDKIQIAFDNDKDNVIISVKDYGSGIAPEHLKRIFDRFYRVDKSRSKEKGGRGLGLSIVQEIIEAHNSKVLVTSKLGKGTTFAFILKKAQPEHVKI